MFPEVSSIPDLEHYQWQKKVFSEDQVLFKPGQACDRFMLLGRGAIRVELQSPQSRAMVCIETGQLCSHSLINLINDDAHSFIAIALKRKCELEIHRLFRPQCAIRFEHGNAFGRWYIDSPVFTGGGIDKIDDALPTSWAG